MVRYSDELLEEIRNNNDIVDVISGYIPLKRSGRNYFGLCPFHNEKSPSLSVSPDKQIFHCFGCGVGGNVFHFISKIEGINFVDSVKMLAERANITLPSLNSSGDSKTEELKEKILAINKLAAYFYHENLYKSSAKAGQEYVKKRKLNNRTLKNFVIGYSGSFDELYKFLREKGFKDEEILASDLVNKNDRGSFIDRFRNRLMFPIQDERGRFIAFGGRVLDDSKPKYINSPENLVYSKGRHLFALYNAKKENPKNKKILIVEGYMDAISLHQRGITNVVASLGTALTEAQGRLLRRSAEQVILGYDADGAGQEAIMRGLDILKNLGCDVRVLQISGAKDPDEYVTKYGPERLQKCIDSAISLVEFKVKKLKQEMELNTTADKVRFLNRVAQILSQVNNEMEQEIYIDKISVDYDISKEAIYAEIKKIKYNGKTGGKILEKRVPIHRVKTKEKPISEARLKRENTIISMLISSNSKVYTKIKNVLKPEDFKNEINRKIIAKLYEEYEQGKEIYDVLSLFQDEEVINHITEIMAKDVEITDINKGIEDILKTYEKENLKERRDEIISEITNNNLSDEDKKDLEKELNDVIIKLVKLN